MLLCFLLEIRALPLIFLLGVDIAYFRYLVWPQFGLIRKIMFDLKSCDYYNVLI